MSSSNPGWYPVDEATQRYWDGAQWTEHVAPLAAPVRSSGLPTWAKVVAGATALLIALPVVLVVIFALARLGH